jgi:drug/metabolite transporter (DMT)-like permease
MDSPKPKTVTAPVALWMAPISNRLEGGVVPMLCAVACYAATDAMVKWLSGTLSIMEITFFRSVFTFIPVGFVVHRSGGLRSLKTDQRGLHIGRAALGTCAMIAFFLAYQHLPLPDVATLGQTYPLLLVALAGPLLGEVPDRRQIIATALGFLGVLVIVAPVDGFSFQVWHVLPLIGSLCLALNLILLRRLSARETQSSLILYTPLLTSVVTGVSLPWSWTSPSSGSEWLLLATMGIFGGIAFFLRNLAYSRSPASELAPVEYTQILFASILGIVVFGSSPSSHLIVGATLIVASNAWLLRVQASVKRKMMVSTSGLGEER